MHQLGFRTREVKFFPFAAKNVLKIRAGARWLGPHPPNLDVGAPNIQYIAFNT